MLKAVLFDMDETLVDWSGFVTPWEELERPRIAGVAAYLAREVHAALDGDGERYASEYRRLRRDAWTTSKRTLRAPHLGRALVDAAIALGAPDDRVVLDACLDAYAWEPMPGTRVFPDVPPIMERFRAQGLRLGLVTNSDMPIRLREIELRALGLLDFFPDCRVTAADAGYLKPHPHIFRYALEKLGVDPHEAVFVGDNLVADIGGAQAAGMFAVLRARTAGELPEPVEPAHKAITPDAVITTFAELPGVLDALYAE
jgi:putative hydrolase of the HAD superfamily